MLRITPEPHPALLTIPLLAAGIRCQSGMRTTVCHAASSFDFSPTFPAADLGIHQPRAAPERRLTAPPPIPFGWCNFQPVGHNGAWGSPACLPPHSPGRHRRLAGAVRFSSSTRLLVLLPCCCCSSRGVRESRMRSVSRLPALLCGISGDDCAESTSRAPGPGEARGY